MRRRIAPAAGLVLAAVLTLSACTPPAAEPTAWQSTVETVAAQASGGDYAAALATLDALEAEVTARRDAGELPADEAEAILSRIATVRADLISLTPTPTPTPEPVQTSEPVQQQPIEPEEDGSTDDGTDDEVDPGDQGPGNGPSDQAPGGSGNGNGNGNNGNGKDGGGGGQGKKNG
ncbi:hypothetical protein IFU08_00885 [Microbacterium sp. CFBP 8790]|uniref:hypothetical protein n=1 Tax=unclassified Microbacterium TaxID=2609290 RepID=UPI001782666F|nr:MULTISPECIES: hypothetical protein [unclassified Microbacterium]MBD8205549.1 hypothetical protein [Microbacterium sp. CFBP 8801]MBD8508116.1 hypothetical protein [Microbacterium sp. CFBP 8790]